MYTGSSNISGVKNLTLKMPAISKSKFKPTNPAPENFVLNLRSGMGNGRCDLVTSKAFKGIHLSANSPADLDTDDKTLLVNKSRGTSTKNPVFIRILTFEESRPVDLSAPWGIQEKSLVNLIAICITALSMCPKRGLSILKLTQQKLIIHCIIINFCLLPK